MRIVMALLFTISLSSCVSKNEADTIYWINNAEKPIVCIRYGHTETGNTVYTLIDNNQNIYQTGQVQLALPDTIKANNCDKSILK